MDLYEEPRDADDIDDELALEAQMQDEAFHRTYENDHTWEALQEDEKGNLRLDRTAEQRARRRRTLQQAANQGRLRKGMIRYLLLVVDLSRQAAQSDLKPSRLTCMIRAAHEFVRNFFDQNPLSQLGLLIMKDGVCIRLTELSASPETQLRRLDAASAEARGDASLANALDMGVELLKNIPPYGHREMLILFAALSSIDPHNIFDSIFKAQAAKVRVSVVGVAAELSVCSKMCEITGGNYRVALNESHLSELMNNHAPPPPMPVGGPGPELVSMGFPQKGADGAGSVMFVGADARQLPGSYACPRCKARVAELPSECHVCALTLISSPHLARSYHHLFPVPLYQEAALEQLDRLMAAEPDCDGSDEPAQPAAKRTRGSMRLRRSDELAGSGDCVLSCHGCLKDLGPTVEASRATGAPLMVLYCPLCAHVYCYECDVYVHESLHNCPGCEALLTTHKQ